MCAHLSVSQASLLIIVLADIFSPTFLKFCGKEPFTSFFMFQRRKKCEPSTYQKYIVSRDEEKTLMITSVGIGIHERHKTGTGQLNPVNKGI